jgi:hypothetical protein
VYSTLNFDATISLHTLSNKLVSSRYSTPSSLNCDVIVEFLCCSIYDARRISKYILLHGDGKNNELVGIWKEAVED